MTICVEQKGVPNEYLHIDITTLLRQVTSRHTVIRANLGGKNESNLVHIPPDSDLRPCSSPYELYYLIYNLVTRISRPVREMPRLKAHRDAHQTYPGAI